MPQQLQQEEQPRIPDIILAKLDRSYGEKHEELRVALCEYQGKKYAGMRVFWQRGEEWLPGRQGVTIRAKEIAEVIKALQHIAEELTGEVIK